MGICTSCFRKRIPKVQCPSCSKNIDDRSKKTGIVCPNGHTVCDLCVIEIEKQLCCPHCRTPVIQIKNNQRNQFEEVLAQNSGFVPPKNVQQDKTLQIQRYKAVNQQKSLADNKIHQKEPNLRVEDSRKKLISQPNPAVNAPDSIRQQESGGQRKKICDCLIASFLVSIVLIIQTLFSAATMFYSANLPRSECMDTAHLHFLLTYRPLMQQISGVQSTITVIISVSAFVYKKGWVSEPTFDKWMIFLKLVLSMKQLLWTGVQIFMQVVILPVYCTQDIIRFAIVSSIVNIASFVLVIINPVYNCICSRPA